RAGTAGVGEGGLGLRERVAGIDEGARVDGAVGHGSERHRERAAARADELDLVDDDRGGGQRGGAVDGGLEHDGTARAYEGEGEGEAVAGAGGLDDHVEAG